MNDHKILVTALIILFLPMLIFYIPVFIIQLIANEVRYEKMKWDNRKKWEKLTPHK